MLGGREGGREGERFQMTVGKRVARASPVLISCCLLRFPANPETQPHQSNAQKQQAAEKPPVFA